MWFFVDETWSPEGYRPRFGVLLGVLVRHEQLERLDKLLYSTRKKYFGVENAKDPDLELKGKNLLSNRVFDLWNRNNQLPRNLCVVKEILSYPVREDDFYMRVFAVSVFSATDRHPSLLAPDARKLSEPFRCLIERVSIAVREDAPGRDVTLVFDQRLGAQKGIAVAVHRYVAGMHLPNVHPYPYFAVSTASPGVQVADVFAHLLSKRIQRMPRIMNLYRGLLALQWRSQGSPARYGFVRLDEVVSPTGTAYEPRTSW